jgi:hypothetical protein
MFCRGMDTLNVYFVTSERNIKVRITQYNTFDKYIITDFKTTGKNSTFKFTIDRNTVINDGKLQLFVWIKRKFWFGWQKFYIVDERPEKSSKVLSIYDSNFHKYRFRYVHAWRRLVVID